MSNQTSKANAEQPKVEQERRTLNSRMEALRSEVGIHRERLIRKTELLLSCDRGVKDAMARLLDAQQRQTEMLACMEKAPGEIIRLEGEMNKIRMRLNQMDHAAQIAKATDLANQILDLQKMGYKIIPPGGAA